MSDYELGSVVASRLRRNPFYPHYMQGRILRGRQSKKHVGKPTFALSTTALVHLLDTAREGDDSSVEFVGSGLAPFALADVVFYVHGQADLRGTRVDLPRWLIVRPEDVLRQQS